MLDSIRKRKDSVVTIFLVVLMAIIMGFFGFSQMGNDSAEKGSGPAVIVNGEPVSRQEFQQALEYKLMQYQQMLGGQYDEKFLAALQVPQRTMEELIQAKLLAQQATRLGVLVPDAELIQHIQSTPYYQRDGKFDAALYAKIPNIGMEEKRQRERLALSKLHTYLMDRVKMTPKEIEANASIRDTKIDLEYAKVEFEALAKKAGSTPSQVDEFLKKTPEADLKKYYDEHRTDYMQKAQVKLRQIRIGIPYQAKEEQKAAAKKKIEAVAKEVTYANFSELAKKHSDDEYAKKGGEVGMVARGTLEPALEAEIDKLSVGKVSGPVETSFGYFILAVTEKQPEIVFSLNDVKKKIAERMLVDENKKTFGDKKRAEWDKVLADGKSLEPALKAEKIEIKKTGPFSLSQGTVPGVGGSEALLDAVFELSPSKPVPTKLVQVGDAYYFVKLKSLEAPKVADKEKNLEAAQRGQESAYQTEFITQWISGLQKTGTIKQTVKF